MCQDKSNSNPRSLDMRSLWFLVNMKVKLSIDKHVDIHTFSTSTSKLNAGKFVGLSWGIYHGCYSSSALKMAQDT